MKALQKGGGILPPPFSRHFRRKAKHQLCFCKRRVQAHTVSTFKECRAFQNVACKSRLRTGAGDRKPGTMIDRGFAEVKVILAEYE